MNSKKYAFDFIVPQGPTGPTGPMGTYTGLTAYGGRFSTAPEVLNLGISSPVQVPLLDFSTARKVNYSTLNSVILEESGVYEITYILDAAVSTIAELTVEVRQDGVTIPVTRNTKSVSPTVGATFCGNMFYTLPANSVIDLAISSSVATTVTLNNGSSLMLKKIHS